MPDERTPVPEHSPEPWQVRDGGLIGPKGKQHIAKVVSKGTSAGDALAYVDARRIVACVNACSGIATEDLESFFTGIEAQWGGTWKILYITRKDTDDAGFADGHNTNSPSRRSNRY